MTVSLIDVIKTYDTTNVATLTAANYLLNGVIGSDIVALNFPTTGLYNSINVGSNIPVNVSGLSINGASANNYQLTTPTLTMNVGKIVPAQLTVTGVVVNDKIYNGNANAALNLDGATLTNILGSDVVELAHTYNANFVTHNVGQNINVIANLSLTGGDAANYVLIQPTGLQGHIFADLTFPIPTPPPSAVKVPTATEALILNQALFNSDPVLQANYMQSPGLYFTLFFENDARSNASNLLAESRYPQRINKHCVAITSLITLCE